MAAHTRKRGLPGLTLVAAACVVALAQPASANALTKVWYTQGDEPRLSIIGMANANAIELSFRDDFYYVSDARNEVRVQIDQGGNCNRVALHRIRCRERKRQPALLAYLGQANDSFAGRGELPGGVRVVGQKGNDRIRGSAASGDALMGNEGRDDIEGGGGGDEVTGGKQRDRIHGGTGDDEVTAGIPGGAPDAGDSAFGGRGNDRLSTGFDDERMLDCGPGDADVLSYAQDNSSPVRGCEQIDTFVTALGG